MNAENLVAVSKSLIITHKKNICVTLFLQSNYELKWVYRFVSFPVYFPLISGSLNKDRNLFKITISQANGELFLLFERTFVGK